jgi:PAS domain S-box-containing protein
VDARDGRKPFVAEFRVLRFDGTVRWVTERGQFYYAGNGDAEHMLGMAVDITERKLAEEALKKSEEKFSKAFRESPMALTVTTLKDHRYLDVNEAFEQITGWRREGVIGRTPFDLNLWVDPAQRVKMVEDVQTKGTVRNLEVALRTKSGEERLGLAAAELIEIAGEPCVLTMAEDITERKQIQEQLQISQARLAGIVGSAMDAIIATDAERNIVLFNTAAETVFGCAADEAIGTAIDRFIPERFRLAHKEEVRLFGVEKVANRDLNEGGFLFGLRAGGEEFPMEVSISHLETNG